MAELRMKNNRGEWENISGAAALVEAELKAYTDKKVGDVESALDSIIAIQNTLIGGDGE